MDREAGSLRQSGGIKVRLTDTGRTDADRAKFDQEQFAQLERRNPGVADLLAMINSDTPEVVREFDAMVNQEGETLVAIAEITIGELIDLLSQIGNAQKSGTADAQKIRSSVKQKLQEILAR